MSESHSSDLNEVSLHLLLLSSAAVACVAGEEHAELFEERGQKVVERVDL